MSEKLENARNLYLEGIRDGHYVEAVNAYTGDRYTQHSTGVKDGKAGFIEFFGEFVRRNPVRDIQIARQLEDGPHVFLQVFQNINNGESRWVTTDFFDTDEQEKIIEHWDVIAEYSDTNPSGHSSVDGAAEITDLHLTSENKELIKNLINKALIPEGNLDQYISTEQCIQHNKNVADGANPFRNRIYNEIVLIVGQGNFVATLCRATSSENGTETELAQVDLFRIESGKVVEHWDNAEPVPSENVNGGKF